MEEKKKTKPDRRKYTIMLVPHQGESVFSLNIPVKLIKISLSIICIAAVGFAGVMANYGFTVRKALNNQQELEQLRYINGQQEEAISSLAKETAVLQNDVNRMTKLENDVRRLVNADEAGGVSRSGSGGRTSPSGGQGGVITAPTADQLVDLIKDLQTSLKAREEGLNTLQHELVARRERLAATPSMWPTDGEVTSRFGWRSSPWGGNSGDWHPGIDIANNSGTPVYATAQGVVTHSGWYAGYGKTVEINHGNGIVTIYAHNSVLNVKVGQRVNKGELVSHMGNTGNSTGPHLHYEIRVNGTAVNPASFL